MTGIETAWMMPSIMSGSLMRETPPSALISAGTRSRAMTATAPASSAILACSAVTTSMITPPLSISAMPRLTRAVPISWSLTTSIVRRRRRGDIRDFHAAVGRRVVDLEVRRPGRVSRQVEQPDDPAPPERERVADRVVVELPRETRPGHDLVELVGRPGRAQSPGELVLGLLPVGSESWGVERPLRRR